MTTTTECVVLVWHKTPGSDVGLCVLDGPEREVGTREECIKLAKELRVEFPDMRYRVIRIR